MWRPVNHLLELSMYPKVDARTPVIVGVGEITHRTKDPAQGLEPLALMERAVRAAEQDAGTALLHHIDSIDVVCEYSWPYHDAPGLLNQRLGIAPARSVYGVTGGETPVRYLHEAALRIASGDSHCAVITGAEARYSADAAERAGIALPWSPKDANAKLVRGPDFSHPMAARLNVAMALHVYPFFENATLAHWGQTPRQAQEESARLWAHCSRVAQANPHAWTQRPFTPDELLSVNDDNRMVAWPYTKYMVANPVVNQGAAAVIMSAALAERLGVARDRWVFIHGGAAANEPRDYLQRDNYHRCAAQEAVLRQVLHLADGRVENFERVELYSCFPVVPKMARRTLGLAQDAPMTSTGGLTFFGAPLNNYMTHAAAGLVRALRPTAGKLALLYGQGEYVTKHHALVLGSSPAGLPEADYWVQDIADGARGEAPPLDWDHRGAASLETFTVLHQRDGTVAHGIAIARTPTGARLMAKIEGTDTATLRRIESWDHSPIGETGEVDALPDGLLRWRLA